MSCMTNFTATSYSTSITKMPGQLLVCATPIGNTADITSRVLDALEQADVIYAEDTRVTLKLLNKYGINASVVRCDENVTKQKIPEILQRIEAGQSVVLVSDAGTPCISDPGQRIVAAVREKELDVTVLPGPSAVATAVAGSGFVCNNFFFGGFFPRKTGDRTRLLQQLAHLDSLLVFYESNHRTISALRAIAEVFPSRRVCMARELTKMHEEYLVMPAAQMADALEARTGELKGEVVLVIEQPTEDGSALNDNDLQNQMLQMAQSLAGQDGMTSSKIAKQLVTTFGVERSAAYEVARSCNTRRLCP